MGIRLRNACKNDVEEVRKWRNSRLETLRTPYFLTQEMQEQFYHDIVCNRQANSRWWSACHYSGLVGLAGLTNIEWENGLAEISLILDPSEQKKGYGRAIVRMVLEQGFGNMGLKTIYGECYECNPAIEFWRKVTEEHGGYCTMIPRRKLWKGKLYDSLHFTIWR